MLEDAERGAGEDSLGMEKCKPDYEEMIRQANEKLAKNQNFQGAIFNYMGMRRLRNKMAELVGELVSEERSLRATIEDLIKKQAEDSED